MSTEKDTHTIFISKQRDGTFLAASIDVPRFCVGGTSEDEVHQKAQRALDYYQSAKDKVVYAEPTITSVVSPVYKERELSTAH
jgi:predicted RNase H-like HicB family nuclease